MVDQTNFHEDEDGEWLYYPDLGQEIFVSKKNLEQMKILDEEIKNFFSTINIFSRMNIKSFFSRLVLIGTFFFLPPSSKGMPKVETPFPGAYVIDYRSKKPNPKGIEDKDLKAIEDKAKAKVKAKLKAKAEAKKAKGPKKPTKEELLEQQFKILEEELKKIQKSIPIEEVEEVPPFPEDFLTKK
jgi:hypothetical protein